MTSKYLVVVCALMLVTAVLGSAGVALTTFALPPAPPPTTLAWNDDPSASMVEAALADARVALGSSAVRALASRDVVKELESATHSADSEGFGAEAGTTHAGRDLVRAVERTHQSATGTATVALGLFGALALSGLLGFARLFVRGLTMLSCALLALAGGAGCLLIGFDIDVNLLLVALATVPCVLALFGQLVSTNLMPNANHPLVVRGEQELMALPAARRWRHVRNRIFLGFALSAVGVCGTLASLFWVEGPMVTVFTGAFVSGLFVAALPVIATARVAVRAK